MYIYQINALLRSRQNYVCKRGPCFLVAWNIHVSCYLSYAMHNYSMRGQTRDSHEWNTCRHKCALIHQQVTYKSLLNSVHNSKTTQVMHS